MLPFNVLPLLINPSRNGLRAELTHAINPLANQFAQDHYAVLIPSIKCIIKLRNLLVVMSYNAKTNNKNHTVPFQSLGWFESNISICLDSVEMLRGRKQLRTAMKWFSQSLKASPASSDPGKNKNSTLTM